MVRKRSVSSTAECEWIVPAGDKEVEGRIVSELNCSPVLARLLWNRGIRTPREAEKFLNIRLTDLILPERFSQIERVTGRIREALRRREKIAVFGDYDVDGVAGTAILVGFLKRLGAEVKPFLPHRIAEGYGLSVDSVERMRRWGADLIITVDNGVGCAAEIAHGRRLGIDFVITDHHETVGPPPAEVPTLNPKLPGESYPFRDLAGAGVAFKLVWALARDLSGQSKVTEEFRRYLLEALVLAALGTVADVVPLRGENRILTHHGLRLFGEVAAPGLKELFASVCSEGGSLKPHHVAFRLGPRLNAAGRLGEAERALDLLLTEDMIRARALIEELNKENDRRRRLEQEILKQAREDAAEALRRGDSCLVLAREGWHVGVVGIAAARLAEETERPVVLIALDGEEGRGSGRSVEGISLHAAVESCREHLEAFGGHAAACGIRIRADKIPEFASCLRKKIAASKGPAPLPFRADMVLPPHRATGTLMAEIRRLAPFGEGNDKPLFVAENVQIIGEPRLIGRTGNHLAFFCRSGPYTFRCVYFGGGEARERIVDSVSFAYEPTINSYGGRDEIELHLKRLF